MWIAGLNGDISNMAPAKSNPATKDPDVAKVERLTIPYSTNAPAFGSDVVAETLSALDIPYIALNPGASYRGLHDSIVNFLGNEQPQMLLCLHEEAAVAIAHGYAKVTGKAMAAAVHSNVGLIHATMAIFNAWCDRMPILILGATGPVDARSAGPGSTGSTPLRIRAPSSATSASGTTSRPPPAPPANRCCARTGSRTPRRRARPTSTSMPKCRKASFPRRCRRSTPSGTCRRWFRVRPPTS